VPGKPTLYGTTKEFLDYFNLKKLDQLPTLAEIKDLDSIHPELELDEDASDSSAGENSENNPDDDNETQAVSETVEVDAVETLAAEDETAVPDAADTEIETAAETEEDDDPESVRPAINV